MAKHRQHESSSLSLRGAEIYFKNSVIYGILINLFMVTETMLPLEFIHILACPVCKGELAPAADGSSLSCHACAAAYPVIDGIPVLLPNRPASTLQPHCEAA